MNAKQERFCLAYAANGNATQAAIAAGYSPKTARSQGQRLLTNVDVQTRIKEISRETISEKIAGISNIQAFWTEVLYDLGAKMTDRLKASELLARSQGRFLDPLDRPQDDCSDKGDVIIYLPDNQKRG